MKSLGKFTGDVVKYDVERGFGFLDVGEPADDETTGIYKDNAFIYFKEIHPEEDGFKKLLQGQHVEFELYRGERGLIARNLQILSSNFDNEGEANGNV